MSIFTKGDLIVEMGSPIWWCSWNRAELHCRGAVSWEGEGVSQGFAAHRAGVLGCFWACTQDKWWGLCGEGGRSALLLQSWAQSSGLSLVPSGVNWTVLLIQPVPAFRVLPVLGAYAATSRRRMSQKSWLSVCVLAAGLWRNELEVVGIIIFDLLCGNGLKASCFLSRS